jgi:hypothetical protein
MSGALLLRQEPEYFFNEVVASGSLDQAWEAGD